MEQTHRILILIVMIMGMTSVWNSKDNFRSWLWLRRLGTTLLFLCRCILFIMGPFVSEGHSGHTCQQPFMVDAAEKEGTYREIMKLVHGCMCVCIQEKWGGQVLHFAYKANVSIPVHCATAIHKQRYYGKQKFNMSEVSALNMISARSDSRNSL